MAGEGAGKSAGQIRGAAESAGKGAPWAVLCALEMVFSILDLGLSTRVLKVCPHHPVWGCRKTPIFNEYVNDFWCGGFGQKR